MKRITLIFAISILAVSCAKKKTKETLVGEWKVVDYIQSIGGGPVTQQLSEGYQLTFIFEDAFIKNEGYCPMIWRATYPDGPLDSGLEYKVTNGGDLLEVRNPSFDNTDISFTVIEMGADGMILDALIEGATSTLSLEKQ